MPPEIEKRPDESRIQFYENQAQGLLNQYGRDYRQFIHGYEPLIERVERRLKAYQATGYNFLPKASDMDFMSSNDLIFYSHAIYYPKHFGVLLATMEQEGLIQTHHVHFGIRGSTVLFKQEWTTQAQLRTIRRRDRQRGLAEETAILEYPEIILTFFPENEEQAKGIIDFLTKRTTRNKDDAIENSAAIPDIRTTLSLQRILSPDQFTVVKANTLGQEDAAVVVLREKTEFRRPWQKGETELNEKLVEYLTKFDVPV